MAAMAITEVPYNAAFMKKARNAKNYSLRRAAELSGVHYVTIQRIESETTTEVETLKKLCTTYEVPLEHALTE